MSKNYMYVIRKEVNRKPHIFKVAKRIETIRNLVGGEFEMKQYQDVLIIYNKEQKNTNLKENKLFDNLSLKGTILIVGNDEKAGDVMSLRKKQMKKYISKILNKDMEKEI